MRPSVDRADAAGQIGVGDRPSRSRPASPGIIARRRNLQDAGHRANGIDGLVRAHEPVNRSGSPCSPARSGCRLCQDVALLTQAMVLTSKAPQFVSLGAGRSVSALPSVPIGLLHPSGNRLCGRLELTRQLLGRASRSPQIDHLSPELRWISGSITRHQTPQKSTSRVSTKLGQLHTRRVWGMYPGVFLIGSTA